jgi:broad specificity phosphatase PhoE
VLLLRHAETAVPTVFHGAESDIGLSDRGRRQAAALAPLVAAWRPDGVVSSAMRRARETAAPLAAACGLSLQLEPDLHERRVGALSGQPFHGSNGVWSQTLRHWVAGRTSHAPPAAESFDAIADRVLPVWERLTAAYAGRSLAIVAHGVVCKVLILRLARGWSPRDWYRLGPIANAGFTELIGGPCWQLVRVSEVPPSVASC